MNPSFIGIGAYKAGTAWISQCLSEHPALFMPIKESYFFTINAYWNRGRAWYEIFFRDCPKDAKAGEFCPAYLCNTLAPQRIASLYPTIKIIVCLRNPIDRAFSHYLHDIRYGFIPSSVSFSMALAMHPYYLKEGLYADAFARYYTYFSKDQILVVWHEDSKKNPDIFISRIYSFLGVDASYKPHSLKSIVHEYRAPRSIFTESLFSKMWLAIIWITARIHLHYIPELIKKSGIIPLFFKFNTKHHTKKPKMNTTDRAFLAEYFKKDISRLEKLFKISLSEWR
ncbi:MAG: sulfotransferase [bacterium]|nr:sulfotransferase [bacterium]